MPELPEVDRVRQGLEDLVLGARVTALRLTWPKIIEKPGPQAFERIMPGLRLEAMGRRGKYLIFDWGDWAWISHLRMEGKWLVLPSKQAVDKHTHLVLQLDDGRDLRYHDVRKFGRIRLFPKEELAAELDRLQLGPEPWELDADAFYQQLQRRKQAIKLVLLDQHVVAGIGNIYADEILYRARLHPEQPAHTVSRIKANRLVHYAGEVIREAMTKGGTTIRSYTDALGHSGGFQQTLNAYGRAGLACPRCQTPMKKIKVGQRGTTFCPRCQVLKRERS